MPVQVNEYGNKVIPAPVAEEAYKEYSAQFGTSQSLARLNERGGFGWSELAILLFERIKRLERERQKDVPMMNDPGNTRMHDGAALEKQNTPAEGQP